MSSRDGKLSFKLDVVAYNNIASKVVKFQNIG
jgi:hypothetical protein